MHYGIWKLNEKAKKEDNKQIKIKQLLHFLQVKLRYTVTADGGGVGGGSPSPTKGINARKWKRSQTFDISIQLGEGCRPLSDWF